jgi:hypothetical protein
MIAEENYASGNFVGENSEPLFYGLEDELVFSFGQSMLIFRRDPLVRRVTEIIDRVVETGKYKYWKSMCMNMRNLLYRKIALAHRLDGCYSLNLYHTQLAFCILLMD